MRLRNGVKEILFSPGELKISDWRGWTDIEYIRRINDEIPQWMCVTAGNQSIVVSSREVIPVYDDITPKKGFHGASVFTYQLKIPHNFDPLIDFVRIRRGLDSDGNPTEFVHPLAIKLEGVHSNFGYEIGTRSKFFNCNNIHIFGADEAPDKMEVCR